MHVIKLLHSITHVFRIHIRLNVSIAASTDLKLKCLLRYTYRGVDMRRVYGDLKRVERAAVGAWPGDVDRSGPHVFYIQLGHRTWIYSTYKTCTMNEIGSFNTIYMPLKLS